MKNGRCHRERVNFRGLPESKRKRKWCLPQVPLTPTVTPLPEFITITLPPLTKWQEELRALRLKDIEVLKASL